MADYNAQAAPASTGGGGDKGFSLFGWHPEVPNLGGITAIKQLASGFLGLPEQAYHVGADLVTGNYEDLNPLSPDTTLGKFAYGLGSGVENFATSGAGVVGVPFTRYNLGDEVVAPLLQKLNEMGPKQHDAAGNELPTFKPSSFYTRPGGPIAGLVQDALTGALIAAPFASGAATAAGSLSSVDAAGVVTEGTGAIGAEEAAIAGHAAGTVSAEDLAAAQAAKVAAVSKANMWHAAAHPFGAAAKAAGSVILSARDAVLPPISETPAAVETPTQVLDRQEVAQAQQTPATPGLHEAILNELSDIANTQTMAASKGIPEATTTLYHGQDIIGPSDSELWTDRYSRAASNGEHVLKTEVPNSKLPEMQDALAAQGEGAQKGDYYIDPNNPEHQSFANAAVPHEVKPPYEPPKTTSEVTPGEVTGTANKALPGAENVAPENAATIQEAIDTAKAGVRESSVARDMAMRIATPPPAWAVRVTDLLPDSINSVLAKFAGPITKYRFNQVARDYARLVEVSQRQAAASPMVNELQNAAVQVAQAVPGLDRFDLSHIVGEELGAQVTGSKMVESWIKDGKDPEVTAALHKIARNNYDGLTPEMRAMMTPEQSAAFDQAIERAAAAKVTLGRENLDALLASRPGAQGLERAVLADGTIPMDPTEVRMYRQAVLDLRREQVLRERIPDAEAARLAEADRKNMLGVEQSAEADRLAAQVGHEERTAANLKDPLPLALLPENIEGAIDGVIAAAFEGGGATFDVGRNVGELPATGHRVVIAPQFDIPIETAPEAAPAFAQALRERVRAMLTNPVGVDGEPYGTSIWNGQDARLSLRLHTGPDGRQFIQGGIEMSTWGGKALEQWQATALGEMFRNESIINNATGEVIGLSRTADTQNLYAQYHNQILDENSSLYHVMQQMEESAKLTGRITADNVTAMMTHYMTQDYSLSRSNPGEWNLGDYFDSMKIDFGTLQPRGEALLGQTVLDLTTKEGIRQALDRYDTKTVKQALKWYYDSHDFIEQGWRNKTITLLDGSQRNGAELFYDLLAVTSVNADPTTNLGYALTSLANMEKFLASRQGSYEEVAALMKELESRPPEIVDFNGTKLSSRLVRSEMNAGLGEGTAIYNGPKYKVIDILQNRLNLETATNEVIDKQPEFWTGKTKGLGDAPRKFARSAVQEMVRAYKLTGPAVDAYDAWASKMDQLEEANGNLTGRRFTPILHKHLVATSEAEIPYEGTTPFKQVSAARYSKFADEAAARPVAGITAGEMMTPRTLAEWKAGGFKMFMSKDGKTGYALSPEGDLTGVINNGGAKGAGADAVRHAISQGAQSLDAYELKTPGMPGGLPDYYKKFGFKETGRAPWNPEYASGRAGLSNGVAPDVVFMGLDKRGLLGKTVSPAMFEATAEKGDALLTNAAAHASAPVGLDDNWDHVVDTAYQNSRTKWGGATIDTHTGTFIPEGGTPGADEYAVTARSKGQQTVALKASASPEVFRAKMQLARERFAAELSRAGAHLGVFHDDRGMIEIDPVYVAHSVDEADAVGAASHATGGAYHFQSGTAHWPVNVEDQYETQASLERELKATRPQGREIMRSTPEMEKAYQHALAEYHGTSAITKMRSFRDNLSDPHNSVAVTLDSVMAKMYGMIATRWDAAGMMGKKAAEIREEAAILSKTLGEKVMPHEVQALLWVYTKDEIGRMDWSRLLAHHDIASGHIDDFADQLARGLNPDPYAVPLLRDWWEENLGQSRQAQADIQERDALKAAAEKGPLSPEDDARYKELAAKNLQDAVESQQVLMTHERGGPGQPGVGDIPTDSDAYWYEERKSIPYKTLGKKEDQFAGTYSPKTRTVTGGYVQVEEKIHGQLAEGDIEGARKTLQQYVTKLRKSQRGDLGSAFNRSMIGEEGGSATALETLAHGEHVPAPDNWLAQQAHGTTDELHSKFQGHLRGALLTTPDKTGRYTIRLFENAAIDTLAHEGAHLLRQILPAEHLQLIERLYPHITDAVLSPEKIAAEEKFVDDFMLFMRESVHTGTHTGPAAAAFEKIGATLEEQHASWLDTASGRATTPDIRSWWTRMFHPGIERPDVVTDPVSTGRVNAPLNAETKQFRWESPADYAQRTRQYGEARVRVEVAKARAAQAARDAARTNATARRMYAAIISDPTEVEQQAQALNTHAHAILAKLAEKFDNPSRLQVPREWQPMWEAFQSLHAAALADPRLNEYLDEIPATWSAVLREAAQRGFEPQYLPDMTWEQAQRWMFGHIRLGPAQDVGTETTSAMRKQSQGILRANQLGDRSIEALAAAGPAALHELYSNKLVEFIETNWAKPFTSGAKIPAGWVPWSPEKQFILTGTRATGERIAVGANQIVPEEVARAIKSMSGRYDHWAFHTLSKITKPWITYNLTLSPRWYLHVAISNIVRAIGEGVSLRDWSTVIKQWKTGTLPEEVYGHSISSMMADGTHSLLGRTITEAKQNEGMVQALKEVRGRVMKVHDVLDELNRGAVFEHTLRSTGSREYALTRSYEAMVDYGNLSPFERGVIRQLIPFYPFYKGMVKLLARFPADHPVGAALLLMSGKMHEEYLKDQFGGKLPDAYRGYANIGGLHNFTILDPFINPTNLVDIHNISSTFNPFIDIMLRDAYNAAEPGTGQPGMDATGHPITQVNLAKALGSTLSGAAPTRFASQLATGGDVYNKQQGVAGAIGQFAGVPQSPNLANIQAAVAKSTAAMGGTPAAASPTAAGTAFTQDQFNAALAKALAAKPHKARAPRSTLSKSVAAAMHRVRGTTSHRRAGGIHVRAPRKVRRVRAVRPR